jgi:hypothetical protein
MVHARLKGLVEQDPCLTRPPSCTRVGGHLSRLYTRTSTSYPFFRGSLRTSMMTEQPPVPGNTTSSAPPRQMSCPGIRRPAQNNPLPGVHSCRGISTTALSSAPLSPPRTKSGLSSESMRHTANPTTSSFGLLTSSGTLLWRCSVTLVTLLASCFYISLAKALS